MHDRALGDRRLFWHDRALGYRRMIERVRAYFGYRRRIWHARAFGDRRTTFQCEGLRGWVQQSNLDQIIESTALRTRDAHVRRTRGSTRDDGVSTWQRYRGDLISPIPTRGTIVGIQSDLLMTIDVDHLGRTNRLD